MKRWLGRVLIVGLVSTLLAGSAYGWRQINTAYVLNRARQAVWADDPALAVAELQARCDQYPRAPELAYLMAVAQRRDGKTNTAREELKRAATLGWSRKEILRQRHLIDFQAGQIDETEPRLLELIAEGCSDEAAAEVYECFVKGYLADVRIREAGRVVDYWLQWRPNSVLAHLLRSEVLEAVNDKRGLIDEYRKILEVDPLSRLARFRLGFSLLENQDIGGAQAEFERYLASWPTDGVARVGLASCERQRGRLEEAEKLLKEALQGGLPDAQRGFALSELGQIALARRSYAVARDYLEQAVAASPASSVTHYGLAMVLSHLGEKEAAETQLEQSRAMTAQASRLEALIDEIVAQPKDASLRCEAGEILLAQGQTKQGHLWLLSALRCEPSHAATHRALAEHYQASGNTVLARQHAASADLPTASAIQHP
jgi:predicted Zn-dependent protease